MEMGNRDSLMEMYTVAIIKIIDLMDLVPMDGEEVPIMKEVSKMDSGMGRANGHLDKPNTQETMLKVSRKDTDSSIFRVAIFTKGILSRTSVKDMAKCFGLMVLSIRAIGKEESKMEKDKSILWEAK